MRLSSIKLIATGILTAGIFSGFGFVSAATTATSAKTVLGVPINTFCSTYAKDVSTKSVAISLVIKIKDNPSQKASLMRQYGTFTSLGKLHCKDQYAPSKYNITSTIPTKPTLPTSSIDISGNTPIINKKPAYFTTNEDYFTGFDTSELKDLNSQQLDALSNRIPRAKVEYGKIVDRLISDGWLGIKDKDEMVGKITFKFSNNCNQLDGKILVRQRYDQNNNPLEVELLNLFITINLCFNNSYEQNFETFLDRIIYHELGHYYNYFYDSKDETFKKICRSGSENICTANDYISSYARTSADEDYAEMFSNYLQTNLFTSSSKLQQKIDYFKIRDPRYK